MKKAKWLSEEALQIAEKIREAKGKGKEESEKVGLKLQFRKLRLWPLVQSLHGK